MYHFGERKHTFLSAFVNEREQIVAEKQTGELGLRNDVHQNPFRSRAPKLFHGIDAKLFVVNWHLRVHHQVGDLQRLVGE